MPDSATLDKLTTLMRYHILAATTKAGSGHPTSSLSGVELIAALLFARSRTGEPFFRFRLHEPAFSNNDRLIFSKGHASPLFYAAWAAAGGLDWKDMMTYRQFDSPLEGHPTRRFPYTEAATGSLGQGLSIGVGMAINGKYLDTLPYRTFVLLGDSEMAEGSQWEAIQLAAHYGLHNLVAILDVNRLGQRGETMYGHDINAYADRVEAFGWQVATVEDGHDIKEVAAAYETMLAIRDRPLMVIARTLKGAGVSALEDKDGWHGKPLPQEEFEKAVEELGGEPETFTLELAEPEDIPPPISNTPPVKTFQYAMETQVATRQAYGNALKRLALAMPDLVVLDAEVSNSTKAETIKEVAPGRFFEMFIAEQNMVGAALGMFLRGRTVCVSSFAAFLERAYDQIRMARYSDAKMLIAGSHAGVSIGQDGPSQMGLEDIAFFRAIQDSAVLYPADAVSTERLVEAALERESISYLRTTRAKTPVIYKNDETFPIGGCKVLRQSRADEATIVAAGITLHEALAAADTLAWRGVAVRVIDLYSVKPVDAETLRVAARETGVIITVEDHAPAGGIGEAV
ncbi:MAG: transketolase, partial [Oceanidesulfovibrio sp.]